VKGRRRRARSALVSATSDLDRLVATIVGAALDLLG
jgi:hypothetical protein